MKHCILFVVLIMCILTVKGQDFIIKNDKTEIKAKVIEIQEEYIKYYLFESPEGPIRNIRITDVFMIIYSNGTRETFTNKNTEKTEVIQAKESKSIVSYQDKNQEKKQNDKSTNLGFIFGGKAGYYIPYSQNISEIYGGGFMGGLVIGYWAEGAGLEIDWRYYSKAGDPYTYGSVDQADCQLSISPLTLTGYWDAYHKGNFSSYVGAGLGVSFIKEDLVMSAFGQTGSTSASLTGFEFHSTGGIRFSPFYIEITFSSCTVKEIGFGGILISGGLFF